MITELETHTMDLQLQQRVADFYAHHSEVISDDQLERWPEFYTEDCLYKLISRVNFDRKLPLGAILCESRGALLDRVTAIRNTMVYAAGLYLPAKTTTPEAVYAATGAPRRIHIVMLRDIDGNELGKLFTQGMEKNSPREIFAKSINGTIKMADLFSKRKKLASGESFSVDWIPNTGTVIMVNGKPEMEPIKDHQGGDRKSVV